MFAHVLLALVGLVLGFAVIYLYRLWHASARGCAPCLAFVELRRLAPVYRLCRSLRPGRKR